MRRFTEEISINASRTRDISRGCIPARSLSGLCFATILAICAATAPAQAPRRCGPILDNPRVTCDRWPSNYDARSWSRDVWRLENAQTPEDKTLALYKWVRLQQHWGDPCFDGTRGKSLRESDAIKMINIFPYGESTEAATAAAALGYAGGLKAMEARLPEHTQLDVFYKDNDGQERWHRLDPLWGIVVYDKSGSHIATWQEIRSDPNLATAPVKTVLPFADKQTDREGFAKSASFDPERKVRPSVYTMDKPLYAGVSYLLGWDRMDGLAFRNNNPDSREAMTTWGAPRFHYAQGDFDNLSYSHELLLPSAGQMADEIQVRQAHGALLFAPLLNGRFADSLYQPAVNIATGGEGRTLRPAKAGKPAELVYLVQTPYVIVDSKMAGDFLLGEGGQAKVSISLADWRQRDSTLEQVVPEKPVWKTVWESGAGPGARNMRRVESDLSLRGEYKFLVKVQMLAARNVASVEMSRLAFTVRFQEGVMALPRLLPGENTIRMVGGAVPAGYQILATYTWDDTEGQMHTASHSATQLPATFKIKAVGTRPADVRTRGLLLQAVHETDTAATQPAAEAK